MGRNYQHKHGSGLFSGDRPQREWPLAGSIAKGHSIGKRDATILPLATELLWQYTPVSAM